MRYGIRPEGAFERLALLIDAVPVPAIDVLVPLLKARAIMAGVRLGIFKTLAAGPRSPEELAAELGLDGECLRLLLRVLVSSQYLRRSGERFELTSRAAQGLLPSGSAELSGYVEFNYVQWDWIAELEQTLCTGRGVDFHRRLPQTSPAWASYQRAMLELARPVAHTIAVRVPVRQGARRLLDLGGSHGLIGAALCRANPPLRSTVLELPPAVFHARQLAVAEGITDVVEHRAGDALCSEYGSDYDVVLLCNLLHYFSAEQAGVLLARAVQALDRGGTIAIWGTELPSGDAKPELASDALALYFRITSSAPGLGTAALERKLVALGCEATRVVRSIRAPGHVLLHARRPD